MKMVCVGDCGIDRYMNVRAGASKDLLGGITLNFVYHAHNQFTSEWEINVVTALGNDANANIVIAHLEQQNLSLHISRSKEVTPVQEIYIKDNGEKVFGNYESGSLTNFRMRSFEKKLIVDCDLLMAVHFQQIEGLFLSVMDCPSKGLRAVDFADFSEYPSFNLIESCLEKFDIGFFGLELSQQKLISELKNISSKQKKLFVITLAAAGSVAFFNGKEFHQPAEPVLKVVDTTGAGDSFAAAFLSQYCIDKDIQTCLKKGALRAAETVVHLGATW